MKYLKNIKPFGWLLVLVLGFFAIQPLLSSGFFPMHDNTQVQRVYELNKSLSSGMLPVRWVSDLGYGYGYPVFNFYAPLAYYFGALVMYFVSALIATKIMITAGILLAGITMYFLGSAIFGDGAGIIAGLLYLYAPYHGVDVYVRGDIAELWAYAFIPLVFYSLYKLYQNARFRYVVIGAVGASGVILSHNLTALMAVPFFAISTVVLFFFKKDKKTVFYTLSIFILAALLSAFYWLPVFPEMKFTNVLSQVGGSADFHNHFVCFPQLWNSPWGYGGSVPGCNDGFSFMMGKLHIILGVLGMVGILVFWQNKIKRTIILLCSVLLLLSVFMMLPQSVGVWEVLKPMAFLQYPWRYLVLASLFSSLLSAAGVSLLGKFFAGQKNIYLASIIILSIGIIFLYTKDFVPQYIYSTTSDSLTALHVIRWDTSKLTDEYLPKGFIKPEKINQVPTSFIDSNSNVDIISAIQSVTEKDFTISVKKNTSLHINLAYFPTWHIFMDKAEVKPQIVPSGIEIGVSKGTHALSFAYIQTPIEKTGDILTLSGIAMLLLGIIIASKKKTI